MSFPSNHANDDSFDDVVESFGVHLMFHHEFEGKKQQFIVSLVARIIIHCLSMVTLIINVLL
jgi:hypothetical protein